MEFMTPDISILFITVISATVIFAFYSFASTASYFIHDFVEAFAVIDIVRILKKVCPVGFGNKWRLLPLTSSLSRCWSKKVQFPGFQNSINLCGAACAVTCSSMYAFSLIADVTKWGEWEPLPSSQCLLLKSFCDKIKTDTFMHADQVVGIQRGTDVQSYVAMYRFMSFTEKTVKWILFWNAKKVEFMFFLIQPAVSKTVDSQCVITHIYASKQLSSHLAPFVTQRLRNIKDFLLLSQLHVIASKYAAPAIPIVPSARWHRESLLNKPSKENNLPVAVTDASNSNIQIHFMLVPVMYNLKYIYNRLKGFRIVIKKMHGNSALKKQKKKEPIVKYSSEYKETLKRSRSDTCIKPRNHTDFGSNLNLNYVSSPGFGTSAEKLSNAGYKRSSVIIEEDFVLDMKLNKENDEKSSPPKKNARSLSEPGISTAEGPKTFFHSDCSELHTDEETYVSLNIIHENVSEENILAMDHYEKNDMLCSSTSDFELVDSNQQFLDCKIADFLTQGNYGASELQAEMMLTSQFNKRVSSEEQHSGGWIYHSTCKGITVLAKTTAGQFMKIVSFLCQIELPVKSEDVWKCVKNPRFRFFSDETVKTVEIVERISNSQKLIHVYHETSGFMKKEYIDFCLLQTEREEVNHYYSSFHSIEYGKCPFMTSVVRGSLRPSGWVVERIGSKRCKVTHLMQILVNSPDSMYIQELSSLVPLSMHNLKNYTTSSPK